MAVRPVWIALIYFMQLGLCSPAPDHHSEIPGSTSPKLLYILMDGFRWDYVDKQDPDQIPSFSKFLQDGVRANWTNPIFPTVSFPTWTTLVTGLFAETHGIVGNHFYDADTKESFSLWDADSTGKAKWWTAEPLWTTAEKDGLKTAQYLWGRCDVPIDNITTDHCEPFEDKPGKDAFLENINKALQNFEDGYDFVQVYTAHIGVVGHNNGPDSEEISQAVRDLDNVVGMLMTKLEEMNKTEEVNIVIVSDHGMTNTKPGNTVRHEIDEFIDLSLVENIAGQGALMNIKVLPGKVQEVKQQLSRMHGVTVLEKDEVPEDLHYKNNKYVHEIIVRADEGNLVMGSLSEKQLPKRDSRFVDFGAHGYDPDMEDMKGIFFAKGPAFRQGIVIDPIHVVDVYQVLTNILELSPNPHNGTWSAVEEAFEPKPEVLSSAQSFKAVTLLTMFLVVLTRFI